MRLGEFLQPGNARRAPVKHVTFQAIGRSTADGSPLVADVEATMLFVSETDRQLARHDADKALREIYGSDPIPEDRATEEFTYQILFRALRDSSSDSYKTSFAETVKALKNALVYKTAIELDMQYTAWVSEEFPDFIDQAEFNKLVEEAEGKSLAALLKDYGYLKTRAALASLAARFGK